MILRQELARLARDLFEDPIEGAPEAEFTVAPPSGDEAAAVLEFASSHNLRVLFWGSGSHQSMGYPISPHIVMTTSRLNRIVDWQEEDLTVVVQPGVSAVDLEARLQQGNQTPVLPETPQASTVGGIVAAGLSGWRRFRYGPTRDRMLEVRLATGDGRLIRGGGRLVKNVTGYDLPRLAAGSFGSLGLVTEVCLKLWPVPPRQAMLRTDDPDAALRASYRPLAVVGTPAGATVFVEGTGAEVEAQAESIGGDLVEGHQWPLPLIGSSELALRIPPTSMNMFVERVSALGVDYQAAYGVGEIRFVSDGIDTAELTRLRADGESVGGAMVVMRAQARPQLDPWGTPPDSVELQRRVKAAFDPRGVANPGRLPGGI